MHAFRNFSEILRQLKPAQYSTAIEKYNMRFVWSFWQTVIGPENTANFIGRRKRKIAFN
jgi:hypothetical protein